MKKLYFYLILLIFIPILNAEDCHKCQTNCSTEPVKEEKILTISPKITMIELGSESCRPCREMKKVMKKLEENFSPEDLKIEFYDIRKNKAKRTQFHVTVMPTQVFLNEKGREIYRHKGFFPYEQIVEFLKKYDIEEKSEKDYEKN